MRFHKRYLIHHLLLTAASFATAVDPKVDSAPLDHNNNGKENNEDNIAGMKKFIDFWESEASTVVDASTRRRLTNTQAIFDFLKCDLETSMRIPTQDDYALLVETYLHVMTNYQEQHSHNNITKNEHGKFPTGYDAKIFHVPTEVEFIPHVGRGIFATENISSGTLVWESANTLVFYTKDTLRDFLALLVLKRSRLICDCFEWMYSMLKSPDDQNDYVICLDADNSSLINSGEWSDYLKGISPDLLEYDESNDDDCEDDDEDCEVYVFYPTIKDDHLEMDDEYTRNANINIGQRLEQTAVYGCQNFRIYALRDIQAGEELLMSYGDFSEPRGFRAIGLYY